MPFSRPALATLRAGSRASFAARLPGADQQLRRSLVNLTADTMSGMVHLQYGYLVWLADQLFPDSAETVYLERWARIFKLTRKPATFASGTVVFAGSGTTDIPAGTSAQTGAQAQYATTADGAISGGAATIAATALVAGDAGNTPAGTALTLSSAIAGIAAAATVGSGGMAGGFDEETDDDLRVRLMLRIQQPPQGGSLNDYRNWMLEVPGVTRAWPLKSWFGVGTIGLAFAVDNAGYGPIPESGDVAAVQAYVDDPARAPVVGDPVAFALAPQTVAPTISGLSGASTAAKAAIVASLTDLFFETGEPGGTVLLEQITGAIASVAGVGGFTLTLPAADVVCAPGAIPVLGTITYS